MKSIHYAGDTLLTGDAIADALVRYAAALARAESSTALDIPVRFDDGSVRQVNFLIGPASQIVAIPVKSDGDEDELIDAAVLADLEQREAALGTPTALGDDEVVSGYDLNDLDL